MSLFADPAVVQTIHGQDILLREAHDFSWLDGFGRVFVVLQGTVSGCLGFGVERDRQRWYLRHAGALPHGFFGDPAQAVADMRDAEAIYARVEHPALNPLLSVQDVPGGYVQMFPWLPGFPMSPPQENHARFRTFPLVNRLAWYDQLVDLLALCEQQSILPLGLGESHIIIDDKEQRIALSTIHRFRFLPCYSAPGRTPGTPWYRAPESHTPGVALGETAGVFTAGALAYAFLGDRVDHTDRFWEGSPAMLSVARTAVQLAPGRRQRTIRSYLTQWRQAVAAFDLPRAPTPL